MVAIVIMVISLSLLRVTLRGAVGVDRSRVVVSQMSRCVINSKG